jgi:glycine/D-amino acid oxidase-like deaminating enzyme
MDTSKYNEAEIYIPGDQFTIDITFVVLLISSTQGVQYIDGQVFDFSLSHFRFNHYRIDELLIIKNRPKVVTGYVPNDIIKIEAGLVVNAAGAWAGRLVDILQKVIESNNSKTKITRLPIESRKRCIFVVNSPHSTVDTVAVTDPCPPPDTPLVIDSSGVYFRPERKLGTFIVGVSPTVDKDPDCLSDSVLEHIDHYQFEDIIWPILSERVPAFEQLKVLSS